MSYSSQAATAGLGERVYAPGALSVLRLPDGAELAVGLELLERAVEAGNVRAVGEMPPLELSQQLEPVGGAFTEYGQYRRLHQLVEVIALAGALFSHFPPPALPGRIRTRARGTAYFRSGTGI